MTNNKTEATFHGSWSWRDEPLTKGVLYDILVVTAGRIDERLDETMKGRTDYVKSIMSPSRIIPGALRTMAKLLSGE